MGNMKEGGACSCMHHQMVPVFITLLGLLFLLHALGYFSQSVTDIIWPIILILIGLQKMMRGKCKCC